MCGRYLEIDDDNLYEILAEAGIDYAGFGNVGSSNAGFGNAALDKTALCVNEQLSFESTDFKPDMPLPSASEGREIVPANIEVIIVQGSAVMGKWGFPKWKGSGVIFNARSETALEKAMFKKPLLTQRCVIPSKGFFEWGIVNEGFGGEKQGINGANDVWLETDGRSNTNRDTASDTVTSNNSTNRSSFSRNKKKKDKYLLRKEAEQVLLMAGMASMFRDPLGRDYLAYVILTTNANGSIAPIHDRMPVILDRVEIQRWLEDSTFIETVLHREGPLLQAKKVS